MLGAPKANPIAPSSLTLCVDNVFTAVLSEGALASSGLRPTRLLTDSRIRFSASPHGPISARYGRIHVSLITVGDRSRRPRCRRSSALAAASLPAAAAAKASMAWSASLRDKDA